MKDLTISVVSHGQGRLVAQLLDDLRRLPGISACKVIVTLNLPEDPIDFESFAPLQIQILRNSQPRGFGANHNAAFAHCRTRWFAVLNPDLRIDSNPFESLFEAAQRCPEAVLLAPRILNPAGGPEDSVRANLSPWSLVARHLRGIREPLRVDGPSRQGLPFYWLAGMFLLVWADAFRAVHGFDERYFMYCEDYDLCARLYAKGYTILFEEKARVTHAARRDSHRSFRHLSWHVRSLGKVWRSLAFWAVTLMPLRRAVTWPR